MKIIHTIAGVQVDHGGTSRSVPATIDALAAQGCDVHLLTGVPADPQGKSNFPADCNRVTTVQESAWTGRWFVGQKFSEQLERLVTSPEESILHDHGLWLPSNRAVARFAIKRRVARIVSPRGMLGTWSLNHHAGKKQLAWRWFQQRALQTATAFHATSQQEAEEIRRLGFTQPLAVIPNGVDIPEPLPRRQNSAAVRQAFFMSRIHPKKGLIPLVRAWKLAVDSAVASSWRLVLAGPDEAGHQAEVQREIERLGLANHIRFLGPLNDTQKWQWYVDSDLFILPSFDENFGIVIAEAMAAGLPVITTTGTPWSVLQEQQIGWWVAPEEQSLAQALRQAVALPAEEMRARGQRGQAYVRHNYSWSLAAEQLLKFYKELLHRSSQSPDPGNHVAAK